MHDAHAFLTALTIVLGVAAVTTYVFQRLHQPVVLGYILAGLIIGPHVSIPLIADPHIVQTLSELGVILLMFGLGLEFSLAKLFRAAPTAGLTGLVQCSVMVFLGYLTGRALGWTTMESIFAGAVIAISSTTIIAKAFDEQRIGGRMRELVVAILIVEDLVAVVLMAILTGLASGTGLSGADIGIALARLIGFLVALVVIGLLVVPRVMRVIVRLGRAETTIIAAIAVCFGISLLAHEVGYSVALGAFVAGMLVAESGEVHKIEALVNPVRDIFAAVFFVSVGMMLDPMSLVEHWLAVLVFTVVVILGKIGSVALGAFLVGSGTRTSVAAGMSLAQIGEFSFIIAGLGLSLGVIGDFVYPVAVAVSAITTLTTPWLIRASGKVGSWVDRKLPKPLQTFVGLYEGWIEKLRRGGQGSHSITRRLVRVLLLDVLAVAGVVIAFSLSFDALTGFLVDELSLPRIAARLVVVAAGGALALPFCVGILRTSGRIATELAAAVVPIKPGGLDLGRAPRRMLVATLRLAGLLMAGLPLVALTQPFLPGFATVAVLGIALVLLLVGFWRSARDLHGHVRASAQVVLEALSAQSAAGAGEHHEDPHAVTTALLPGLTDWERVEIPATSRAVGKTLAELELRGKTGATVLAIRRDGDGVVVPGAQEPLRAGDVLAITGSREAMTAATELLQAS